MASIGEKRENVFDELVNMTKHPQGHIKTRFYK